MIYTRKQLPKYCRHKPSGRAYVRIGSKMYYLGKYGSEASKREYDRVIAEFVANGRQPFYHKDETPIKVLVLRYLNYLEKEVDISESRKAAVIRTLRTLNALYGTHPVAAFGPSALKALRQRWIDEKLGMASVNAYISTIKQVFVWGCEEEIVPADLAGALKMVQQLQKGRTSAVVYDPIQPVSDAAVEATLPHLKPHYRDMVKVQRYISGRPQDVLNMRPCDIDRSGEIWKYTPFTHKTKKRGKIRELPVGPKAQQILTAYLEKCKDDPTQFIFAMREGKPYTSNSYAGAVRAACLRAGIAPWSPNQLRHAGATEIREKYGLEYAQASLGHSSAKTTEIYAKTSFEKAAKVAKEIG